MALAAHHIRLALRQGQDLLLLFADLDNMKIINDRQGHEAGDTALQSAAAALRDTFRESDVIGRLGGDEFAMLVAGGPPKDDDDKIRQRLTAGLKTDQRPGISLAASIGIAHLRAGERLDLDELLKRADGLMYAEKQRRKTRQD